jgi:hypothetical protein
MVSTKTHKVLYIGTALAIIVVIIIVLIVTKEKFSVSSHTLVRPHHPKFYEDISEDHPEVLQLKNDTANQMAETPTFTVDGYKKMQMPEGIYKKLLTAVRTTDRQPEGSKFIFRRTSLGLPPYVIPIPEELRKEVNDTIKPILEEWSGVSGLIPTSSYGPREYRRGSSLRMHVDIGDTHIISAILQIDREGMDKDWPLVIINRKGERQNVYLKGGEMLLYESASLPHSRELPLEGEYFVNMFIHFAPPNYKKMKEDYKNSLKIR